MLVWGSISINWMHRVYHDISRYEWARAFCGLRTDFSLSKVIYAAQLLGIIAIACGKASAAFLVQRIALLKLRYLHAFLAVVAAWTVFSLLATAFQCHLPYPWILEPSNCPTRGYLQYVVTAVNMITDVILSTWVIGPVWKIEMVQRDRLLVIFLFGVRIMCVRNSHPGLNRHTHQN